MELDSVVVTMRNDQPCHTIGVWSIFIRMYDSTVRELIDVRHVLDIRKNLLSVGALTTKGYKIVIEIGVLKIYHGALVFLKGVRHHNLYYLQSSIVTEMVIMADVSSEATLRLMRLAYVGEASLKALVKKELIKAVSTCKLDLCEYCVFGKKTHVSLVLLSIIKRVSLSMFIQIFGVRQRQHNWMGRKYFLFY
ncbi:hypothetical protein KFK09_016789 [Dendrobium nobile]|uniref:GAG-pre-integrase domain-containing protein n=1 Tax=Dendrobium nobile TaxID=94219 RepID=A0A8T3B0M5_DENNO|nr:hypothetical protein KFK09_016789 [Dendrobium nobile]